MSDISPRAAPAPALAPFHHARFAPGRRRRLERVLVLSPPPRSRSRPMPGARRRRSPAGSTSAPGARWPASRSVSKSAATAPACRCMSQTAEQAATQAPITAKLGEILVVAQVYDPKLLIAEFTAPATISDHGAVCDDRELEQGPQQRGGSAGGAAARLDRVRRSLDRTIQWIGCRRRWRSAKHVETAWPPRRRLGARSPRDRNRAADRGRQRAGAASAAGAAVRRRHTNDAERAEGFFAKTLAASGFAKSRPPAAMSRSFSRGFSRAI